MNVLLALPVVLACWPCRLAAMALTFPLVKVPPAALATLPTIAPALAAWPLPHPALPPCLPCRPAPTPQKREGFSLLAFLKTPYGMMAGFMLFSMFILPKLKVGGVEGGGGGVPPTVGVLNVHPAKAQGGWVAAADSVHAMPHGGPHTSLTVGGAVCGSAMGRPAVQCSTVVGTHSSRRAGRRERRRSSQLCPPRQHPPSIGLCLMPFLPALLPACLPACRLYFSTCAG